MEYIEKTLTGIITHGTNSITFTDDFITNESIIDVYFSSDDIVPTNQEQISNRLIISIEPQNYDVSIAIHITNDDTINYADELESLSDTVDSLSDAVDNLSDAVDSHTTTLSDLGLEFETLESKVDGLNASNISYDEFSTIYSAMGDIDTLETTSKNLVGAINEIKESGGGGGGGSDDYSLQESVIGTWINGETLYRIVVTGTGGGTSGKIILSGASYIDKVTMVHGYYTESTGHYFVPGYRGGSPAVWADIQVWNGGNVWFYSSKSNVNYTIAIEYTKTE